MAEALHRLLERNARKYREVTARSQPAVRPAGFFYGACYLRLGRGFSR